MEAQNVNRRIADWIVTDAAAVSTGTIATMTGVTGHKYVVTSIDASSDAAAVVTVESPAGTVLWRKRFNAAFNTAKDFTHPTLKSGSGSNLIVKVSAATSNSEANAAGYTELG